MARRNVVATHGFYLQLGKTIRGHRIAAELSLRELGARTGISPRTLARIEEAKAQCLVHMVVVIATELDLSLDFDLFPVTAAEERKAS